MTSPAPHPSATVVLLRHMPDGFDVLLLRRNPKLAFHGGAWVFPGGRIDEADRHGSPKPLVAARRAAVREAHEEAGVVLDEHALAPFAIWTTPENMPKRFVTWFFAAAVDALDVRVDGGEIHEHRWMRASDALAAQRAGEIELPPPTFVTLHQLESHREANTAVHALAARGLQPYTPRLVHVDGGLCSLYEADAGYETSDPTAQGTRHRTWMLDSGWRYERVPS